MTRVERRLFFNSLILGLALTLAVTAVEYAGGLEQLERWFYDVRARNCQFFDPPPTDKLVHVDIDDRALEAVGAWPWRRSVLAEILDEIRIAGAKAVAMDVIFPEPQEVDYDIQTLDDGTQQIKRRIDHDAEFAAAIRRSQNVLLPAALEFERPAAKAPESYERMRQWLAADLELTEDQVARRLSEQGVQSADVAGQYLAARRDAAGQRVREALDRRDYAFDDLRRLLLPRTDPTLANSPQIAVLRAQYDKLRASRALWRFTRPIEAGAPPPPLLHARVKLPPILPLSLASVSGGFVDYIPFGDGVVRAVPLWVNLDGRMYPQMGLALACMMLGTDPGQIYVGQDQLTIPLPSGPIDVPVRSFDSAQYGRVGMLMDIPWFGTRDWATMYDYPRHRESAQHVSITHIWDICDGRRKIERNNANADRALEVALAALDPSRAERYFVAVPDLRNTDARREIIGWANREMASSGLLEQLASMKDDELDATQRRERDAVLNANHVLAEVLQRNDELRESVNATGAQLAGELRDKAVLIGWIATGVSDIVPTSLHARCPGVVVHGAIFNAIMTGNFWRFAPEWITLTITLGLGAITALLVGLLTPSRAIAAVIVLAAIYLAINGIVLFDYGNRIVGVAGPVVAMAVVWAGCTLIRLVGEAVQRERIKRRFENYVDPKLVNYVLENPDRARLDGEVREMTVVFTDLAGFTTLSEKLKERTVELLNDFLSAMVPVIRDMHHGYVNKFLGDGIMFFYGAPLQNPRHATDAVATVLDMLKVLKEFNVGLSERGLPGLSLRAGISSGDMVVGDAGSKDASDYTVLGDCVNFGARLESANKALGTCALLSQRTVELVDSQFLVRPVGKIQVVGKTEGVETYEVLSYMQDATAEQKRLAEVSGAIVRAFQTRTFDKCLAQLDAFDHEFGCSKFSAVYRQLAEEYLKQSPPEDFDGKVVLTEK